MNYTSDTELVAACGRENAAAQRLLFDRFAPKIMSVCLRYAPNRAEAEDILQEVFVKVFDHIARFRLECSLESWIRRIAINTALTHLRRQVIRFEPITEAQIEIATTDINEPLAALDAAQLLDLVAQMPVGYRVVFNLFALEGFSHAEIAERLGIEVATSRSQLVKARRWLQDAIQQRPALAQEYQHRTAHAEIKNTTMSPTASSDLNHKKTFTQIKLT